MDPMLLTDGEDGIAKQPETINASIKQCVAFQGLQFTCFFFFLKLYPPKGWTIILPDALPKGKERDHIYLKSLNMRIIKISGFFFLLCIFPMHREVANLKWIRSVFPPCPSPLNQHIVISVELIAMVGHSLNIITLKKWTVQIHSNLFIGSN